MDNRSGKGLSFVKRIYLPRVIGLGIGLFSVMAAIAPLSPPTWAWLLVLCNGLLWPHMAYLWASRSAMPYQAEQRNLLLDSLMGGFWTAAMHFNPLPSVTVLSMMTMNNVAAGGKRMVFRGLQAQLAGMLASILLLGPGLQLTATPLQVYACLPMLTLYPLSLGWVCYQLAIKLADHKRRLSALSLTDSLTGLLNHGAWKDLLMLKFQACKQQQGHAVIALIDIDHFKTINDTFGHVVGDYVLRQLSAELRRNLREGDQAGRYGGDEFCVMLPDTSEAQACQAMERLREQVANYRNPQLPHLRISLSIGLSPFEATLESPEHWLDQADKALYTAKHAGRNQVNFARSEASTLKLAYPD
ncbi:diguanylate cyclase AdrA [Pseudomonas monteilii]|uniref:diguanylate cyclase n=1 Tax=Pseudomonas monteilii TaxID=76759 RepID=A0AAP7FKH7_9PSED|nr:MULTISPECIES: diguanylate cyclase [Pseudomonas]AYN18886.1 diguanylate cyclase AdrA [Pseudomonas monteilii]AYO02718.1 diguanylate cyclase [Pseudomonas sp. LTGT-11-2Z]MBA6088071.1 diguanylate cyclase [Pseudomonas monteilii]MBA6104261.1 diguanylate cyclase [Pseudomonas monteilii]MCE0873771.1 diguanylate cyclase [Pseudomonas monteilii]